VKVVFLVFLHSLYFLFLKNHRSLDYVNLIIFVQVLSYFYWTESRR